MQLVTGDVATSRGDWPSCINPWVPSGPGSRAPLVGHHHLTFLRRGRPTPAGSDASYFWGKQTRFWGATRNFHTLYKLRYVYRTCEKKHLVRVNGRSGNWEKEPLLKPASECAWACGQPGPGALGAQDAERGPSLPLHVCWTFLCSNVLALQSEEGEMASQIHKHKKKLSPGSAWFDPNQQVIPNWVWELDQVCGSQKSQDKHGWNWAGGN